MRFCRFMFVMFFCFLLNNAYSATLTSTDIDTGTQTGSTTDLGNGDYTVTAGGSDIWDNSDNFRYLSQSWSGDLDIRVRVDSIGNTNVWSKAGVMLRASTDGNAKHISMFATPGNGFAFQHRDATGSGSLHTSGGANTPPNSWVRLVKRGTLVTGYTSNNGTVWYRVDSATWSGTDPILVGLAVTSHDGNNLVTAELRGYSATVPPGPINGFISDDINTHIEGATSGVGTDGFSVTASGGDIWNNADGFRFVHQTWSGNFDLRAKVESIDFTDYWAKAGVMVRQNTSAGSVHAFLSATSQNGYAFQRRTSSNGSSDHTWGGDTSYPNSWVRLIRNGNVITSLKSVDGALWEVVDTLTLSTSDPVEVGLAVTAHNDNLLCKAEFRNVSLTSYTPPVVGSGAGLLAQYFNSPDLSSPAAPFNVPVLTRVEADLNNDWTGTSPNLTFSQNNFSARWVGELEPQYSETYTFYLTADDGVRLWIGNTLVIDKWIDQPPTTYTATVPLQAGKKVGIKMEYYQKYGQAVARLKWSSASCPISVIPQSQLSSASGVSVALPATSQVSPAFFEGLAWNTDGTTPSVTANGGNGIFISDNNWFANATLNSDGSPTSTTVTNTVMGGTIQQQITWTATNITGKEDSIDSITIRKGDALLLTASAAPNTVIEIDPDGNGYQFSGAPDQKYPFTYNTAGTFIASVRVPVGTGHDVIGTITINVMDVDLHKPIADELGYERVKNVVVTPPEKQANLIFTSGDQPAMTTNMFGPFDNEDGKGTIIHLTTFKRGTPILIVRIGSLSGPILAAKEVDEFTVDTPALQETLINADLGKGANAVVVRPYIPGMRFEFQMFAHTSTFEFGQTTISVDTSDTEAFVPSFDTDTNETVGTYILKLEVPDNENQYCFTSTKFQSSSAEKQIGYRFPTNGSVCKAKVYDVLLCPNGSNPLYIQRTQGLSHDELHDVSISPRLGSPHFDSPINPPGTLSTDKRTIVKWFNCKADGTEKSPPPSIPTSPQYSAMVYSTPLDLLEPVDLGYYSVFIDYTEFPNVIHVAPITFTIDLKTTNNFTSPPLYDAIKRALAVLVIGAEKLGSTNPRKVTANGDGFSNPAEIQGNIQCTATGFSPGINYRCRQTARSQLWGRFLTTDPVTNKKKFESILLEEKDKDNDDPAIEYTDTDPNDGMGNVYAADAPALYVVEDYLPYNPSTILIVRHNFSTWWVDFDGNRVSDVMSWTSSEGMIKTGAAGTDAWRRTNSGNYVRKGSSALQPTDAEFDSILDEEFHIGGFGP